MTWEGPYADTDYEVYPTGYAQFYSGRPFSTGYTNKGNGNVTAYYKVRIPYQPIHDYEKMDTYVYLRDIADQSSTIKEPFLVGHNLDVDEAYKIADENPEITYFQYLTENFSFNDYDNNGKLIWDHKYARDVLFYRGSYDYLQPAIRDYIYLKQ